MDYVTKFRQRERIESEIARLNAQLEALDAPILGKDSDFAVGSTIVVTYRFSRSGANYTAALVKFSTDAWATTVNRLQRSVKIGNYGVTFDELSEYFKSRDILSAVLVGSDGVVFRRIV